MSSFDALRDRDRTLLDGRIVLDDEDELAVLAGLHGLLGTTVASDSVASRRLTRANWPGHSRGPCCGIVAFSLMVSVVVSTVLSTKVSTPSPAARSSSCGVAMTGSGSPAVCAA